MTNHIQENEKQKVRKFTLDGKLRLREYESGMCGVPEKERSVCTGQDRGLDVHACKLNKLIMIQDSSSTEMWSTVLFCLTGNSDETS